MRLNQIYFLRAYCCLEENNGKYSLYVSCACPLLMKFSGDVQCHKLFFRQLSLDWKDSV